MGADAEDEELVPLAAVLYSALSILHAREISLRLLGEIQRVLDHSISIARVSRINENTRQNSMTQAAKSKPVGKVVSVAATKYEERAVQRATGAPARCSRRTDTRGLVNAFSGVSRGQDLAWLLKTDEAASFSSIESISFTWRSSDPRPPEQFLQSLELSDSIATNATGNGGTGVSIATSGATGNSGTSSATSSNGAATKDANHTPVQYTDEDTSKTCTTKYAGNSLRTLRALEPSMDERYRSLSLFGDESLPREAIRTGLEETFWQLTGQVFERSRSRSLLA